MSATTPGGWISPWLCGRDDAPWLEGDSGSWSRAATRLALRERTRELARHGVRPGDRVGWLPAPRAEGLIAALAILELGAELVLLPLRETAAGRDEAQRRLELRGRCDEVGRYQELRRALGPPRGLPGRLWLRTSGSLAQPRWLRHGLPGLLAGARAAARHLQLNPRAGWMLSLPLDHVGGLGVLLRGLVSGCRLRLPGLGGLPADVARADHDWFSLVPAQLLTLLEAGQSPQRLRGVLVGGAPLPADLQRRALAAAWPLVPSYGATETGALVCAGDPDTPHQGQDSGRPFTPHRLRLTVEGRVEVASPALYEAELDEEGDARLREGLWWRSGDLACWERGRLRLLGRADRVLISGGEKIPAERVEEALLALPEVRRAAVVSLPDLRYGERPAAFLDWRGAQFPSVAVLAARLEESLPRHMQPDQVWPWPADLPAEWKAPLARLRARALELLAQRS